MSDRMVWYRPLSPLVRLVDVNESLRDPDQYGDPSLSLCLRKRTQSRVRGSTTLPAQTAQWEVWLPYLQSAQENAKVQTADYSKYFFMEPGFNLPHFPMRSPGLNLMESV
eukprot:IDg10463t1